MRRPIVIGKSAAGAVTSPPEGAVAILDNMILVQIVQTKSEPGGGVEVVESGSEMSVYQR